MGPAVLPDSPTMAIRSPPAWRSSAWFVRAQADGGAGIEPEHDVPEPVGLHVVEKLVEQALGELPPRGGPLRGIVPPVRCGCHSLHRRHRRQSPSHATCPHSGHLAGRL